jgi:NAD(P)-dependent dehydrogenase (short-subunit alcohol dehydrogenase family)
MLLENKNAVIYGAGGGIGGGVARTFAREGARVFLAGATPGPPTRRRRPSCATWRPRSDRTESASSVSTRPGSRRRFHRRRSPRSTPTWI